MPTGSSSAIRAADTKQKKGPAVLDTRGRDRQQRRMFTMTTSSHETTARAITIEAIDATHWTARVEDAALAFERGADDELRVRDIDLAQWLGYAKPRDVRELIIRMEQRGELGEVCRTVRQTPAGGRPAAECWLTREQSLKIAARSETPRASELLDLIVRVFLAVLDGRIGPAVPANDDARYHEVLKSTVALAQAVGLIMDRLDRIEQRMMGSDARDTRGALGRTKAREILSEVRSIATLYTRDTPSASTVCKCWRR
ncbi:MAG: hypothetical protein HC900_12380 [Methylacidiphilales bacterium]|nr:hypothetical protein [Candidatus Methylacidiphilales bacterium]